MYKRFISRIFLILFVLTLMPFSHLDCMTNTKKKKLIRVIFNMSPATTRFIKGKSISVYRYNPSKNIIAGLKKGGFRVVSKKSKNYDLSLKITYRERARQMSRYPGDPSRPKIMIDRIGFVLENKDGTILLEDGRGPFSSYTSMKGVTKYFIKDLIELVKIRIKKGDETSCWIEFVSRRGDKAGIKAIEKAGNPKHIKREEQLFILKPLLRSHNISTRVVSLRLLQRLEYTPDSIIGKVAFFIVQSYPFHRWSATVGEQSPGAWAARQGVLSIIRHGTTALDLFVEDLKGKQNLHTLYLGVRDGGVANRAKALLMRISKKQWTKFRYSKFSSIGRRVVYIDYNPESDFIKVKYSYGWGKSKSQNEVEVVNPKRASEVYSKLWKQEWNDYVVKKLVELLVKGKNIPIDKNYLKKYGIDNRNYFQDVINILGKIADSRVIDPLKNYLSHPKLAKDANKAIKEIEKRKN